MKCHSWRSESETGAAWKEGFGLGAVELSSAVSLSSRRRVVDGAIMAAASRGYARRCGSCVRRGARDADGNVARPRLRC